MKKVAKSPLVMDVLNITNVQRQLERLADWLNKIQKALGEYLERERASFPRFYFVGDEDLLEIIGNSKNLPRLQKHFKKMFAGVHSILLDEDHAQVLGLASKEGEEVIFTHHICKNLNFLHTIFLFPICASFVNLSFVQFTGHLPEPSASEGPQDQRVADTSRKRDATHSGQAPRASRH